MIDWDPILVSPSLVVKIDKFNVHVFSLSSKHYMDVYMSKEVICDKIINENQYKISRAYLQPANSGKILRYNIPDTYMGTYEIRSTRNILHINDIKVKQLYEDKTNYIQSFWDDDTLQLKTFSKPAPYVVDLVPLLNTDYFYFIGWFYGKLLTNGIKKIDNEIVIRYDTSLETESIKRIVSLHKPVLKKDGKYIYLHYNDPFVESLFHSVPAAAYLGVEQLNDIEVNTGKLPSIYNMKQFTKHDVDLYRNRASDYGLLFLLGFIEAFIPNRHTAQYLYAFEMPSGAVKRCMRFVYDILYLTEAAGLPMVYDCIYRTGLLPLSTTISVLPINRQVRYIIDKYRVYPFIPHLWYQPFYRDREYYSFFTVQYKRRRYRKGERCKQTFFEMNSTISSPVIYIAGHYYGNNRIGDLMYELEAPKYRKKRKEGRLQKSSIQLAVSA